MASEIDICNLALSHLGDTATVASIDPPEGSAQAEYCARFYPMARDALLEIYHWRFATRRATLPLLTADSWDWAFAYGKPADALKLLSVLPAGASSDDEGAEFDVESDATGATVILTDEAGASIKYIALVTDTTIFPPLFVMALSWQLASMLAGPILKGDAGAAEAKRCAGLAQAYISQAAQSDANQRKVRPVHTPAWMAGR